MTLEIDGYIKKSFFIISSDYAIVAYIKSKLDRQTQINNELVFFFERRFSNGLFLWQAFFATLTVLVVVDYSTVKKKFHCDWR